MQKWNFWWAAVPKCSKKKKKKSSLWRSKWQTEHRQQTLVWENMCRSVLGWTWRCFNVTSVNSEAVWKTGRVRKWAGGGRDEWSGGISDLVRCWSEVESILHSVIGATGAALHPQHVEIYSTVVLTVITQDLQNTQRGDQVICSGCLMEFVHRLVSYSF